MLKTKEKRLVYEGTRGIFEKEITVFDDVEKIRVLSNPVAWKIMQILASKPSYPAEIAKSLGIYEQSAYYYIHRLASIGAIQESGKTLVRGGTARLYRPSTPSFGLEMDWGEKQIGQTQDSKAMLSRRYRNATRFFKEYISDESFGGLIVVGAPDPHGPYKSSARDGHYATHLALLLGAITKSVPSEFIVKLDTDAKAEKVIAGNNIISIGGPGTNIVTAEFNKYLPIRFSEENFWAGLVEARTGNRYNMDNHGLIAKIKNPYDGGSVIVVAGVRSIGTKSAVIALANYSEQVLETYAEGKDWALVVQGFDMNSDGKIDHVDIVSTP